MQIRSAQKAGKVLIGRRNKNHICQLRGAAVGLLSDPNLTPLPTHPWIKYVARSPCCDD